MYHGEGVFLEMHITVTIAELQLVNFKVVKVTLSVNMVVPVPLHECHMCVQASVVGQWKTGLLENVV